MNRKLVSFLLAVLLLFAPTTMAGAEVQGTEMADALAAENIVAAEAEEPPVPVYLDDSGKYTFKERAVDLVSRLTLEEKASQMANSPPAISRLGITAFVTWNEALHGLRNLTATSYPISGSMGNTWNPDLVKEMSDEIAQEARANMNNFLERPAGPGTNWGGRGMTFWSPVIEPQRDPRWGRNSEAYSEDTFLTAKLGGAFVDGLMGDDDKYVKAFATGKHFIANNVENVRMYGSSLLTETELYEYYIRPYRSLLLNSKLASVMTAYNRVNDVPMSASVTLVDTLVRKMWGMKGYVTGDCQAVSNINNKMTYVGDKFADEPSSVALGNALALIAGVDTDCSATSAGTNYQLAVTMGYVPEHELDEAIATMYETRLRLGQLYYGQYDPWKLGSPEYVSPAENMESEKQREIATRMGEEAVVLLENKDNFLPLRKEDYVGKKIALLGPYENRVDLGGYSGSPSQIYRISPRAAITSYFADTDTTITSISGATDAQPLDKLNVQGIQFYYNDGSTVFRRWDTVNQEESFGFREYNDWSGRWIRLTESEAELVFDDLPDTRNITHFQFRSLTNAAYNAYMSNMNWSVEVLADDSRASASSGLRITGNTSNVNFPMNASAQMGDGRLTLQFKNDLPEFDPSALDSVKDYDLFLVFVGADTSVAAEEKDRPGLKLTGSQHDLVKYVSQNFDNTVIIMETMGMMEVEEFKNDCDALVYYQYNGQAQGESIKNVLFSVNGVVPGGRLPMTWYKNVGNLPGMEDYSLTGKSQDSQSTGRTYMYYDGEISYPFGYGLTYTNFTYSNLRISSPAFTPNDGVTVTVDVKNNGSKDSSEVVQVYVSAPDHESPNRPNKKLMGFDKVWIPAGETKEVSIFVDASELWYYDDPTGDSLNKHTTPLDVKNTSPDHVIDGHLAYMNGEYIFEVASAASNLSNNGPAANSLKGTATMEGELDLALQAVTVESGTIGTSKPRVIKVGDKIQSVTTVSLNNDTFLDSDEANITYSSNRKSVATVDKNGLVRAVGEGVVTITATVEYKGDTMTSDYALKVMPGDSESVLYLSTDAHNVIAGDYFEVNASFVEAQASNAIVLNYTFDGDKFEYANYTPAAGVAVVDTQYGDGFAKITLMARNYDAENLGDIMLRAKENAILRKDTEYVVAEAEYAVKDTNGVKAIATALAATSFKTLGSGTVEPVVKGDTNDDGVVDIIDLSNIIDWFGFKSDDKDWESIYTFFDFDNNGKIDIYDITYIARLIV